MGQSGHSKGLVTMDQCSGVAMTPWGRVIIARIWVIKAVDIVCFMHRVRDVRMIATFDVSYHHDTHTSIFTLYVSVTLEYCTSCRANSLVASPGSGNHTFYCFVFLLSLILDFCLTHILCLFLLLWVLTRVDWRQARWLHE